MSEARYVTFFGGNHCKIRTYGTNFFGLGNKKISIFLEVNFGKKIHEFDFDNKIQENYLNQQLIVLYRPFSTIQASNEMATY